VKLFDVPAASLFCNFIDLGQFLGTEVRCLPESIHGLEDINDIIAQTNLFLSQRLTRTSNERNYVAEAASLMRKSLGTISIEEVSNILGISMRQLQRCFKESTGTGPKAYLRIIRFRNALASLRNADKKDALCDLTYSLGYADQAHFIREFREFAGEAPKSILKNSDCYHKKPVELTDSIFF
jgi:transcriptional regulator GlxA family with amidase domain